MVVELPHLHSVTVAAYTRAGPRIETALDNGMSHFVEHMMYRGCERYANSYELNFAVEALGATLEGETGRDYTMFSLHLPPPQLRRGLDFLAAVLTRPQFEDIELERLVAR